MTNRWTPETGKKKKKKNLRGGSRKVLKIAEGFV
jgi:hypothetical protein